VLRKEAGRRERRKKELRPVQRKGEGRGRALRRQKNRERAAKGAAPLGKSKRTEKKFGVKDALGEPGRSAWEVQRGDRF